MKVFKGISELAAAKGEELGVSDWVVIDQARIDLFGKATDDTQWIHTDVERASKGPFGGTIAHGLLTLSLLPSFLYQIYRVDNVTMGINYGLNKVRLPSPVPAGAKLRARTRMIDATPLEGAVQVTLLTIIEIEGGSKPAGVVESIARYVA
ncbi:MAG: MaoC family dehydratase [Hyphomicrobiales bacterium]|nr:MAG: MaoC family dehydratase [Hyphomicrobiales bacterium]